MIELNGKKLAKNLRSLLKEKVLSFYQEYQRYPKLTVVLVGDDPASQVYVRNKILACKKASIISEEVRLPMDVDQKSLNQTITKLNADSSVDAILVQFPLPEHLSQSQVLDCIDPIKDADGLCAENMGLLVMGRSRVASCTPAGIIQMLKHYDIEISGSRAVVLGRSQIVGKPMALLLTQENATVTLCHSKTKELNEHLLNADIVIVAIGKPKFLDKSHFKKGAVVIDVGIHRVTKADGTYQLCGDVNTDNLDDFLGGLSPVPGGVGPMTIQMLLENTVRLAELRASQDLR